MHWAAYFGERVPLPGADRAADETLCLPLHASLSDGDVERVVWSIRRFDPR